MHIEPNKLGLTLGAMTGGLHLLWSLFVAFGWADVYLRWILRIHFIQAPITIMPFNLNSAIVLIIVTAVIGYAVGYGLGVLWNRLHKK